MSKEQRMGLYLLGALLVLLGLKLYALHQQQVGQLELRIEQAQHERDIAEGNYHRARSTVVHDTVVVRQTITKYEQIAAKVNHAVALPNAPDVPAAQVRELLTAGDSMAAKCAQFIDHVEPFVVSADALNLTSKQETSLLEQRKPSRLGKVVSLGIAALAGIGLGAIAF